jgi:hypothetical protein
MSAPRVTVRALMRRAWSQPDERTFESSYGRDWIEDGMRINGRWPVRRDDLFGLSDWRMHGYWL